MLSKRTRILFPVPFAEVEVIVTARKAKRMGNLNFILEKKEIEDKDGEEKIDPLS